MRDRVIWCHRRVRIRPIPSGKKYAVLNKNQAPLLAGLAESVLPRSFRLAAAGVMRRSLRVLLGVLTKHLIGDLFLLISHRIV